MAMTRYSLLLLALALTPPSQTSAQQLLNPHVRDLLHHELSGEQAKDHVIAITRHNRIQGSRGYRDAGVYVLQQLRRHGFRERDAWVESHVSDMTAEYQTWISPSGWHIESGELRMVEPFDELIVRYEDIAMSVVTYSNAGDVTAELLWVGAGTSPADYDGKDVRGKIVLCTGPGGSVHRLAVLQYGAAAVACYLDDERSRSHPDMLRYTGMWPRPGELERTTFGFNLTRRQGERLRDLLAAGDPVVLRGRVEGPGLEPFFMDTPVALIRGSERPHEEFVLTAHLDHPKESANDNASGSAALIDIARAIRQLVDSGRMPAPKRSIRFLWVAEYYGTMAYIDAHPEMIGRPLGGDVLGNINMDMVGPNLEISHSSMMIRRSPLSNPSVLNDVVENMAQMLDELEIRTPRGSQSAHNFRVTPYSGGSDHMMFNALHVPGMMIGHGDWTHHSSEDTPDKIDPVQLQRSSMIAAAAILHLANLEPREAIELGYLATANAGQRLGEVGREIFRDINSLAAASSGTTGREGASLPALSSAWSEGQNHLDHHLAWEQQTLATILHYNDAPEVRRAVENFQGQLEPQHRVLSERLRDAAHMLGARGDRPQPPARAEDGRVPVRLTRGSLQSHNVPVPERDLSDERAAWYRGGGGAPGAMHRMEIVNFIDGRRTITQIRDTVSAGYGPMPTETVARYLEDLVEVGVVRWR